MDFIDTIFSGKKADEKKLAAFGFKAQSGGYTIKLPMGESGFYMQTTITLPCGISTTAYDDGGEVYTLHLIEGATGGFVGQIRTEYENLLKQVAQNCFTPDVFKARQSQLVAQYALNTYGDELEFLWADLPDCAVLRRKDSRKWYAIIMTVGKNKFGLNGRDKVEILDIRVNPEELPRIIDNQSFCAGYHMNKKHWLTILLNGSVDIQTIYKYIDFSYTLAKK